MQACGVSIFRLLRPIALLAAARHRGDRSTTRSSRCRTRIRRFREITFNVVASQAESDIKPRVFYHDVSQRVLYVRDQSPTGGWQRRVSRRRDAARPDDGVFRERGPAARRSRQAHGAAGARPTARSHTTFTAKPDEYEGKAFDSLVLTMDPKRCSRASQLDERRSARMTIAELRASAADAERARRPRLRPAVHDSAEVRAAGACPVLALIGARRSASATARTAGWRASRSASASSSSTTSCCGPRAPARSAGHLPASARRGCRTSCMGAAGVVLLLSGARARPISRSGSASRHSGAGPTTVRISCRRSRDARRPRTRRRRHPRAAPRTCRGRVCSICTCRESICACSRSDSSALLGIFYISTFMDLADKLFRGSGDDGDAAPLFLFHDAAVRVLRHSDVGARRDAGHDRPDDEEQRAGRDEGVRHQPVSRRGAAAAVRARSRARVLFGLQERVLAVLEPRSRPSEPRHPRISAAGARRC